MGVKKVQPAATFGHPYGMNSTSPDYFLKSHAQEPLLPEREFLIQQCSSSPEPCLHVTSTLPAMHSCHGRQLVTLLCRHYTLDVCAVQYQPNGFCLTFLHGFAAHKPSTEKMRLKAPVPLKTEVPTMGLHSNKIFVTTNAIQAILSKPKQMPEDFRYSSNSSPLPLSFFPHQIRVEHGLWWMKGLLALYTICFCCKFPQTFIISL